MKTRTCGSIGELSEEIASGLSPVKIVEGCLERIHELNGQIRAMIFVSEADALDAALKAAR
jgi:aspartyl-tRNA(Asn)/glutamyl-tRNA(Gln) amidotransferase subunit A